VDITGYPFFSGQKFLEYTFYSEGRHGRIEKIIRFIKMPDYPNIYNLAFGDLDSKTNQVSDTVISNNGDTRKVLATVALAVSDFLWYYPNCMVIAEGSTSSRTRLYQMALVANMDVVLNRFRLYGLLNNEWEIFVKNRPYKAFLIGPL
jgi:hypothetical protein